MTSTPPPHAILTAPGTGLRRNSSFGAVQCKKRLQTMPPMWLIVVPYNILKADPHADPTFAVFAVPGPASRQREVGERSAGARAMLHHPSPILATLDRGNLRSVLECLASYAFVLDVLPDGSFRYAAANRRFEEALALTAPISGMLPGEALPPQAGTDLESFYQRCVDTQNFIEWETEVALPHGRRWWAISIGPLRDWTDHVVRILGIAHDISERKSEEQARLASESRLRDALESISEGFALWDADDRLVLCNRHYRDFYPAGAALLEPVGGGPPAPRRPGLRGGADCGRVREERLPDGRWLLASERTTNEGGMVAVRTDITERKRIERLIRRSRATFQAMLDAVDETIAMVNADRILLAINRAGAEELDSRPDRLVGRSLQELFDTEAGNAVGELIDAVLATASMRHGELSWRERCLELSVHPVPGDDGSPVAVSLVARDISDRKRAEAALGKLARAVEQSPAVAIMTDAEGRIDHVNPKFAEMTGYAAEEVIGENARAFLFGIDGEATAARLWPAIRSGQAWTGQIRNRRKDGSEYWAASTVSPVTAANGSVTHVLGLQEDITARIIAEEEAREHQRLLTRYMRIATMGEMAATLAHEVNQPIAAMVNYCQGALCQLASGTWDLKDLAEALNEACREAERAGSIIRNVAGFVRQTPDERTAADVNAIVQSVAELAGIEFKRRGVALELDLAAGLPVATVNVVEIEQVLLNLLRNAMDAADTPEGRRRVRVRTALLGDALEISVDDTGPGFSQEAAERAFAPFYTSKPGGIGMGLAVCRSIIDSYGGQIRATNAPGGGASVRFTLPFERARLAS